MQRILQNIVTASRSLGQGFLHLFYPQICWICNELQPLGEPSICARCAGQLQADTRPTCQRCASTVGPFVDTSAGCPVCRDSKLYFDRAVRLGPYEGLLKQVVLRMKERGGEALAEVVGAFWAERIADRIRALAPDVVVPVPLHWFHHWRRGFNQSEVLARSLAVRLGVPCRSDWLRRRRRTSQQKTLTPPQRLENVQRAFAAGRLPDLQNRTIVVVDDVLTTGATASETARPLRAFKPRSIIVAVLAHFH